MLARHTCVGARHTALSRCRCIDCSLFPHMFTSRGNKSCTRFVISQRQRRVKSRASITKILRDSLCCRGSTCRSLRRQMFRDLWPHWLFFIFGVEFTKYPAVTEQRDVPYFRDLPRALSLSHLFSDSRICELDNTASDSPCPPISTGSPLDLLRLVFAVSTRSESQLGCLD